MGILPFEMETVSLHLLLQEVESLLHLLQGDLAFPLEGGMGFGNKGGDTDVDVGMNPSAFLRQRQICLDRSMIPFKSSSLSVGSPIMK